MEKTTTKLLVFLVFLVTLPYVQTIGHDFIYCDDDQYVFENPQVQRGLTVDGIKWAFSRSHAANWHPLTWLSHMLDVQLFGLNSGAHHLVNVAIHAMNAALLFLLMRMMTGTFWSCIVVAALFALHPLRVESVAWVAERKDVLSGLFFMLTLMTYTAYARRPDIKKYLAVFFLMALGLMAKSMVVTLPCVMLLLDIWPLGRWQPKFFKFKESSHSQQFLPQPIKRLLLEKLPFLCLSAASAVITIISQKAGTALGSLDVLPFSARISNAFLSYVLYLWKTIWPVNLPVFYPHPALVSPITYSAVTWQVLGAAVLLSAITVLIIRQMRERPYLGIGWFWYLGTMVPVIGLVQVGMQSMADRYTYLPLLGIYIMVVWGARELILHFKADRRVVGSATAVVLLVLMTLSWVQVRHWKNTETLFEHAVDVTLNNYFAYNHLGRAFEKQGELDKAIEKYEFAVLIKPDYSGAHSNLGNVLAKKGNHDLAISHLEQSVRLDPNFAAGYSNLGLVYERKGRADLAVAAYRKALELNPELFAVHYNLGVTLVKHGKLDLAEAHLKQALRINPFSANSANDLGVVFMRQGRLEEAEAACMRALMLDPAHTDALCNLGIIYQRLGKLDLAEEYIKRALNTNPDHVTAHCNMGLVYEKQGNLEKAIAAYEYALEIDPYCVSASRSLGFILAGQGNLDRAASLLRTVLNANLDDVDALNAMGFIYGRKGDLESAKLHFEQALRIDPEHVRAQKNLEHLNKTMEN